MSFTNTFSSRLERNGSPYRLRRSEINRYPDSASGRFQYARHDHFTHQKDGNGALLRIYYSRPVEDQVAYESAANEAIAFRFGVTRDDSLAGRCVSVEQIDMGSDERSNTRTWGQEWNFEDGSSVVELIASSNL